MPKSPLLKPHPKALLSKPLACDSPRDPIRHGDLSLLSLARSFSDPSPPNIPSLLSLLSHLRGLRRPLPELLFPPFFRAFAKSNLPHLALQLFDDLLPSFRCFPTVKSLNSALNVVALHRPDLAIGFFTSAVRRYGEICPNVLSFNLLIKAAMRCGEVNDGVGMLREMKRRGLSPDVYSYSTVIGGLCKGRRVEEAMSLLDEMQA